VHFSISVIEMVFINQRIPISFDVLNEIFSVPEGKVALLADGNVINDTIDSIILIIKELLDIVKPSKRIEDLSFMTSTEGNDTDVRNQYLEIKESESASARTTDIMKTADIENAYLSAFETTGYKMIVSLGLLGADNARVQTRIGDRGGFLIIAGQSKV
jgi:hypothetical protein